MEITEICHTLQSYFEETFPHSDQRLSHSSNLLENWFPDSLGIVRTIVFLEHEFELDVKPSDVTEDNFRTIDTLAAYVSRRLNSD